MGFFGKTKVERLLLRLFGSDNVDCMNVQSGSGGLLADLQGLTKERAVDLEERVKEALEKINERFTALEKPKARKKAVRKK